MSGRTKKNPGERLGARAGGERHSKTVLERVNSTLKRADSSPFFQIVFLTVAQGITTVALIVEALR